MRKIFLALSISFSMLFFACNNKPEGENTSEQNIETEETANDTNKSSNVVFEELKAADFQTQMMQILASKKSTQRKRVILDVRTAIEFNNAHLKEAINIDVNAADFETQFKAQLDPNVPVFVYCKSGQRSKTAGELLKKADFKAIFMLEGGIEAWQKAGFEVVFAM